MSSPDVVILGMPGSGKTVFLSILHDTFAWTAAQSVDSPMGFRLEARGKDTLATMGECMAQMKAEKWPAPTHEKSITMLSWDVFMGTQKMFSLSSMDYGGEVYRKAYGGFGVKRDERRQNRGKEGSSAANDMLSDVSGAEEQASAGAERNDDECVNELRAAVRSAKVVCIFISVSDFLPKVKDAKDARAAKEALQINRHEAALTACSLLDDEELARKSVIVLTQAHGKRDAIDLSGGPRHYLTHISKSLSQAAERHVKVPVLALSAVNEDDDDRDSEKPPKTICSEGLFAFLLYVGGCVEAGRLNKVMKDYLACRDAGGSYHFLRMRGVLGFFEDRYAAAVKYRDLVTQFVSSANAYMLGADCFSGVGMQDVGPACSRAIESSPEVQMCREDSSRALALERIWDALLKEEAVARVSHEDEGAAPRQELNGADILALAQRRYREQHGVNLDPRQVVNIPVYDQGAVIAWIDAQLARRVETLKQTVKQVQGLIGGMAVRLENAHEIDSAETLETIESWKSRTDKAENVARAALDALRNDWPFEWTLAQAKDMSERLDNLSAQSRCLMVDGRVHSLGAHLDRYGALVEILNDENQQVDADDCKRELFAEELAIVHEFEDFVSPDADSRRAELWERWESLKAEKAHAFEKVAAVKTVGSLLQDASKAFSGGDAKAAGAVLLTAEEKCSAPIFGEGGYRAGLEKVKTMRSDMASARRRAMLSRIVWILILIGLAVGAWTVLRVDCAKNLRTRAVEVDRLADAGNYKGAERVWREMEDMPVLGLKRDSFVSPEMGKRLAEAIELKRSADIHLGVADTALKNYGTYVSSVRKSGFTERDLGEIAGKVREVAEIVSNACVTVRKNVGETGDRQSFSKLDIAEWSRCDKALSVANISNFNKLLEEANKNLADLQEFKALSTGALFEADKTLVGFDEYVKEEMKSSIPLDKLGEPAQNVRIAASAVSNEYKAVTSAIVSMSSQPLPNLEAARGKVNELETASSDLKEKLADAKRNLTKKITEIFPPPGPGPGSGTGSGPGPGTGSGPGPGTGSGPGPGTGSGPGPGTGSGTGPGIGPGPGTGTGPGIGPGPDTGTSPEPDDFQYYTVKAGDSLGRIAIAHGITMRKLKELNGLTSDVLYVGQILKVPVRNSEPIDKTVEEIRRRLNDVAAFAKYAQSKRDVPTVKYCEARLAEIEKLIENVKFQSDRQKADLQEEVRLIRETLHFPTEDGIRRWVNEAEDLARDAQLKRDVPTVKKCEDTLAEIEKAIENVKFQSDWEKANLKEGVRRIRKDLPRLVVIAPYRVNQAGTRIYLDAKPVDKPEHVWRNPDTGKNEAVFEATDIATRMDILCESQVWPYPDLLQEATVSNGVNRVEWNINQ